MSTRSLQLAASIVALLWAGASMGEQTAPLDAKRVEELVPGAKVRSVQPVPIEGGLYEVIDDRGAVFYLDGAARIGFQCDLFDVATKRNLTLDSIARLAAVSFDSLPLELAIKRVNGNGQRRLAVFADPDCPYCTKLEQELAGVEDVSIYTFLYPVASLHPEAVRRSHGIWCSADPDRTWREWLIDQVEVAPAAGGCEAPIAKIAEIAPRFRVNGTPTLVFGSGRVGFGAATREVIEEYLDEPPLAAQSSASGNAAASGDSHGAH